jgi:anaerobic ribonucleoside-triphosphate reductase activating protein
VLFVSFVVKALDLFHANPGDSSMIRYAKIQSDSLVDGPGLRTTIFLQGCTIACPGCQSQHLWPAKGGIVTPPYQLAVLVSAMTPHENYTIMGGEPFDQPQALYFFLRHLRDIQPKAHIIVYSGYTWEQLQPRPWFRETTTLIDVLVDGPFIASLDDPLITYRGSRNQRPIDVPQTLATGQLVTLDWDHPEITIDYNGNLHFPVGLSAMLDPMGQLQASRRCGQSK